MTNKEIDRIECAIRHIKTAVDVDEWAKDIAIMAMQNMIANCNTEKVIVNENLQDDENSIDDESPCVLFCNWNTANEFIENDKNIEDCLVISSYLDDNEAILVTKDEFLDWVRGNNDDTVSIQTYMQCAWERDTAIEQLRELGYGFGEKIRTDGDCISRQAVIKLIKHSNYNLESFDETYMLIGDVERLPSVQPEITLESAIDYLHSVGWMESHDKQMYEDGQKHAQPQTEPELTEFLFSCPKCGHMMFLIDKETVVRCKDCVKCQHDRHFNRHWCNGREVREDFYCADAERRAEG